jgi:Flp pilus assembly protein TadG
MPSLRCLLPAGRRTPSDEGSASLTTVLLTPVFLVIALMAFQAALWSHARTEARAVARDSAAMVARGGADDDDVERSALAVLQSDTDLSDVAVAISIDSGLVVARIAGEAPGLIRGTSTEFEVVEVMPLEGPR